MHTAFCFLLIYTNVYLLQRDGTVSANCVAAEEDFRVTTSLVASLRGNHPEWEIINGKKVEWTYDARSSLFTSSQLPLVHKNEENQDFHAEDVFMKNPDGSNSNKKFLVSVTLIETVSPPAPGTPWSQADQSVIRALDSALFSFARWQISRDEPDYFVVGSKLYKSKGGPELEISKSYVAMRGLYAR